MSLQKLLDNNRAWAANITSSDPKYFKNLAAQQRPEYLWIGCSDSRVPANQITGLQPGEVFVHRNIANVVVHSDFNCLSVIEYAVNMLEVKHIIVCGHYGCGGVNAAMQPKRLGLIDNWIAHIRDVQHKHKQELGAIDEGQKRFDRLCELNVVEQVYHICHTSIVQGAWEKGKSLEVHGWIYNLQDGLLRDLRAGISSVNEVSRHYRVADAI